MDNGFTDFRPSPTRASALDALMRDRLAGSLRHIADQSSGKLRFDEAALRRLADEVGRNRVPPDTFAIYYDLAKALLAGRNDEAEALLEELGAVGSLGSSLSVVPYSKDHFTARTMDRYRRHMDTDPGLSFALYEPDTEVAKARAADVRRALDLLDRADPMLSGEFRGLINQVVLAIGGSGENLIGFGGGSSFMIWGALFLNPTRPKSEVELIETLVHEAAHSLLFGFAIDDPLVTNPDSERFRSPLRRDPRPMEGVYHATYVSARVHYAMAVLEKSRLVDAEGEKTASRTRARSAVNFHDGMAVVKEHGRLTERGAALLAAASEHVEAKNSDLSAVA